MTPDSTEGGEPGEDVDEEFASEAAEWAAKALEGVDGEAPTTLSGIPVEPLYTPASLGPVTTGEAARYRRSLGFPGAPPYTRGITPAMYRERLWVMGQYSGYSSPKETNRRIRKLLEDGQRGFSIALDLPTQNGLDSDHPLSRGEVGRVGAPLDTLRDMEDLLEGIPLDQVRQIRTTANAIGPIATAMFIAAAEKHGYSPADFRVMLQNDPLKEYIARGTFVFPPRRALEFAVDVIEYCARNLPHWEPIEFCGYHVRESGATAIQELAFAIANATEYIDATVRRGVAIDDFAHSLYMFLGAHIDIFEETAKFRAARRLWATMMRERYGAQRDESLRLNLFAYTIGSALTAHVPLANTVRVAYEALSAALGGVQTLATSSYDEAIGVPSDEAAELSLLTQQVLAYETGVARTADPMGGGYYVEALTDRIEADVLRYGEQIADRGGAVEALESGWLGAELGSAAYEQQLAVDRGERVIVGVNRFARPESARDLRPALKVPDVEAEQVARLREIRADRDGPAVRRTLDALARAARAGENTLPAVLDAIRAYATVGEISRELIGIWGEYGRHGAAAH